MFHLAPQIQQFIGYELLSHHFGGEASLGRYTMKTEFLALSS